MAQSKPKTVEQLASEVESLQAALKTANENLTKLAAQVASNTQASGKNAEAVTRLAEQMNQELGKQQELLERIDQLAVQQQDQLARQQAILDAITSIDSQGRDVLRLSANMARSDEFRHDVRRAVHDSLDTHGDVVIRNQMASYQRVLVNQREHGVAAGEVLTLKVPVGTVTVQLPGQPLTNWTVGAPTYVQKIDIVPESNTRTAFRPIGSDSTAPLLPSVGETVIGGWTPAPVYVPAPLPWVIWRF